MTRSGKGPIARASARCGEATMRARLHLTLHHRHVGFSVALVELYVLSGIMYSTRFCTHTGRQVTIAIAVSSELASQAPPRSYPCGTVRIQYNVISPTPAHSLSNPI
jgi:hypothetical protein